MMGRGGAWTTSLAALIGLTNARFWFYQDYAAASGPGLTLTKNDNGDSGTGTTWTSTRIVDSSAVVTDTDGNEVYNAASAIPTNLVYVSGHTGTAVTLTAAPHSSYGTVRIWYLYAIAVSGLPTNIKVAPQIVTEARAEHLDTRFLNQALNLSDITSASTARTNLGFPSGTAGAVLYSDGGTTWSTDASLFFYDGTNHRLGLGSNAPSTILHVYGTTTQVVSLIENSGTGIIPSLRMQASRTSTANLANNDVIGIHEFYGRYNGAFGSLAYMEAIYKGNGTTQTADLVFFTAQAGAPAEVLRLNGSGQIDTTLGAGAMQTDSSGIVSSSTLGITLGGTGQTTANAGFGALSPLTTAGDTLYFSTVNARLAIGTANYLYGANNGATAPEYKAVTVTAAGTLTIPSGQVAVLPAGTVSAPSLAITGSLGSGLYSPATDQVALTAGGAQGVLCAATLVTMPLATLFKISLKLEDPGAGTNTVTLQAGVISSNYTVTLPLAQGTANQTLVNDGTGILTWGAGIPYKAGTTSISSGATTKAITFGTAFGSTNYVVHAQLINTVDVAAGQLYQPITIIAKSSTAFTAEWNEALTTGNYSLAWILVANNDP